MEIVKESHKKPKGLTVEGMREQQEIVDDRIRDEIRRLFGIAALMENMPDEVELDGKELRGLGDILTSIGNSIDDELPVVL